MLMKSQSNYRLRFGWPILAILLSFVAIAPVNSEQFHYNSHGGVILPSRHSDSFTDHIINIGKTVIDTCVEQVKSIVSGTKNLVTAGGQIIASALAYATGNKELGDKLANDAASSAKHVGNDATDLLASGGNLYNKTAEDLNEVVPHLGTLAGMLVSFTPIGPEVALARGFADVKNAFEKGGMNAALQAAAFAALDVAPGGAGKAAKAAKEARAAENAAGDLAKLSALFKQAGTEAKVANDATKLNKFLDYVDKINKLARPKDFVPGRDRDNDGKLQGSGGSNWENRRDTARKLTGYDDLKAKDKAAQQQPAKNEPGLDRPRNVPQPPALRTQGRARLDSVDADEPAPNRDAEQAARDRAYNQERQRIEDEKRQADLREKQRLENQQREADLSEKQRLQNEKRLADLREKERLENEQRQADLREKQRIADEKRRAEQERQRIAEENRRRNENRPKEDQRPQPEPAVEDKQPPVQSETHTEDEEVAAQEKPNPMPTTHTEDEEVAAQKKYLEQLPREHQESEQAAPEKTPGSEPMQQTHTEAEEVQAQKEYLEKLRSEKEQPAAQPPKQSKDDDDNDDGGNN